MSGKARKTASAPPETERPAAPEVAGGLRVWLWGLIGLMFVLGATLGWRQITSPDIGFHLATARWIVENHALPATDPFTYTVSDHPYIDLQWLFQLLVYGLHQAAGVGGIIIATIVLTFVFGGLLLARTRWRDGRLPVGAAVLLLLFFLGNLWEPRPHLLSWVFGSLVLLVLAEHARGSRRWLWVLPLVMLVWVNTHSLFVLGLVIVATYALVEGVMSRLRSRPIDRRLMIWCGVAAAVCVLNPYHVHGVALPFTQFGMIQSGGGVKSMTTGIAEFQSPFAAARFFRAGHLALFQPALCWWLFTGLSIVGLIAGRRRCRPAEWVLFAGFLYLFWRANKNFGYFAMVAFPVAAAGLDDLGAAVVGRLTRRAPQARVPRRGPLAALSALSVVTIGAIVGVTSGWWYDAGWTYHRPGAAMNPDALPVGACQFIHEHDIDGRVINCLADGGYIAWATRRPIFVYGQLEVTGPAFYQRYIASKHPDVFPMMLTKWEPRIAVVRFDTTPYWLYHLDRAEDWRMTWAGRRTAVFLHASIARQVPALPRPKLGVDYPEFDLAEAKRIIARATAAEPPGIGQWLRGAAGYPEDAMLRSSFYLQTGEIDACIGVSLAGLRDTPLLVPDLLLNLGHALNARRLYDLSDACFDAFLRAEDDPATAQEIHHIRRSRR